MSPQPPTYLIVIPWSLQQIGGVNEVVRRLYDELERGGEYRPLVLELTWHQRASEGSSDGPGRRISWMRLPAPPARFGISKSEVSFQVRRPGAFMRLRRFMRDQRVAVVNLHYPGLNLEHFRMLKRLRTHDFQLVVSFHGSDLDAARGCAGARMGRALQAADAIVAPSDALVRRIGDAFPTVRGRLHRVYNGINADEFVARALARDGLPDVPYVLHVGNFEPVKAHDVLLDAWARVVAVRPDVRLVTVGRSGPTLEATLARAQLPDLEGRVEIRTDRPQDEVAALMKGAEMVVLPSRLETFPLVLLEAGATGTAVVASDVGGIPELIRHEESGLLVDSEDERSLADAIVRVLGAPDVATALGSQLERRVRSGFTWTRMADEYRRIVAGGE